MKKYVGIDIGGSAIKGVIIDDAGKSYAEDRISTDSLYGGDAMSRNICLLIKNMIESSGVLIADIGGVGVGCPGLVDGQSGNIIFSGNLKLKDYPLATRIKNALGYDVRITNDANAAALGEAKFGAGKEYSNSILITLGTGVGGGIIIDGKLFEGSKSAGAEVGHMVIVKGGAPCSCGRKGCLEAYASAPALVRMMRKAMVDNPTSQLCKDFTPETVSAKNVFDYPNDPTANAVIDVYLNNLACGLVNFANIFRPQVIMLGGGISAQGERITKPLQSIMDKEVFGGNLYAPVKVVCATLGNRAGAYGAASLLM